VGTKLLDDKFQQRYVNSYMNCANPQRAITLSGKTIQIYYNSDAFNCYFSTSGRDRTGVIVLHAWWGLNDFLRGFCDRLAGEGFSAIAPDLYGGRIASTVGQAEDLSSKLDRKEAFKKINAALNYAIAEKQLHGGKLGAIGFSLGGYFALELSLTRAEVKAVAIFYVTSPTRQWNQSEASYLGHFAEKDPYESAADVLDLDESLKSAERLSSFTRTRIPGIGSLKAIGLTVTIL
jgi:carboxymethylenebutenolidase